MNFQNIFLGISASLMMSGDTKGHWGLTLKKWPDWNFKNLTEFPFAISKLQMKFKLRIYKSMFDVF